MEKPIDYKHIYQVRKAKGGNQKDYERRRATKSVIKAELNKQLIEDFDSKLDFENCTRTEKFAAG